MHMRCDLIDNGSLGVELWISTRGVVMMTYRFESRTRAEQWAKEAWADLEKRGR